VRKILFCVLKVFLCEWGFLILWVGLKEDYFEVGLEVVCLDYLLVGFLFCAYRGGFEKFCLGGVLNF